MTTTTKLPPMNEPIELAWPRRQAQEKVAILAMGALLKNTVCLVADGRAKVSMSHGDLSTPAACQAMAATARTLLAELKQQKIKLSAVAHDLHPDFYSSRFAEQLASEASAELIAVQHHHAHIAAVIAEHEAISGCCLNEPVLGLALDGFGLGTDGQAWGGELLRLAGGECQRLGHLYPLPLPGGDQAARQSWRMAAAGLHVLQRNDEISTRYAQHRGANIIAAMLRQGDYCPLSSSMGRLFDAVAGFLGIYPYAEAEGQAAQLLEQLATTYIATYGMPAPLPQGFEIYPTNQSDPTAPQRLDLRPFLAAMADDKNLSSAVSATAALFHVTIMDGLLTWCVDAASRYRIGTVAFGGGCFLNRILSSELERQLLTRGLKVIKPHRLSPGDAAISVGQAWVAGRQMPKMS